MSLSTLTNALGIVRDGCIAIFLTMVHESRDVGIAYSGGATGFVMIFVGLGKMQAQLWEL